VRADIIGIVETTGTRASFLPATAAQALTSFVGEDVVLALRAWTSAGVAFDLALDTAKLVLTVVKNSADTQAAWRVEAVADTARGRSAATFTLPTSVTKDKSSGRYVYSVVWVSSDGEQFVLVPLSTWFLAPRAYTAS
jgi:hypothetical protein